MQRLEYAPPELSALKVRRENAFSRTFSAPSYFLTVPDVARLATFCLPLARLKKKFEKVLSELVFDEITLPRPNAELLRIVQADIEFYIAIRRKLGFGIILHQILRLQFVGELAKDFR